MTILIPVVGILCTTLFLLLWYPKQIKTGRLAALYTVDSARSLSSLDPKSLEYKLLASGLNIKPITFRLLRIAAGVCGMVIAWLFLPGLPAIVIGGILFYIPGAWLDGRVKSRGRNIDQLLPIAIGRTAAGLLAGGSVPDVLQQVGESLELEKTNPLTPEFVLTASEMRIKDRVEALRNLASRSPSVSLSNLAQLLEGYTEAGGRAYTGVLMDISSRVQQILIARNRAQAKAGDSLVSAKVLPVVLIFILIYLSQDPMVRSSLIALPVQIVIGVTMAAMVGGYFIIRSMIMEAV
ncbi:MAG: type II secretion system F family protein [Bellilinea sp.]|jgi:Flp pilus assembly protein TadB